MGISTIGVSIAVPEPYGSLLQERRAGFGDPAAHAIPTHITLLPPTEVASGDLPAFNDHLGAVAAEGRAFPLRLLGTGTFRPLSPVVFVRLAEGIADCYDLQERVRSGSVRRELQFPYHPHVTVGHGITEEAMDRAQRELADFDTSWTAGGFSLYAQGADGVWRTMRHYAFGHNPFGPGPAAPGVPQQAVPVDAVPAPGGRLPA